MMSDYECETTCPHRDRLQTERDRLRATLGLVVSVANARDGLDYTWAWEQAIALLRELKTVGDDYPGSSCQRWCYEQAGISLPSETPVCNVQSGEPV